MKKLTNEIVDARLIKEERQVCRVGDYVNAHLKIEWKCKVCNNTWLSVPYSILNHKTNCPLCSINDLRTSNEKIDKQLIDENRLIIRIESHFNNKTHCKWQCQKCQYIWGAYSSDVLGKNKSGCPKCANKIITNADIDLKLVGRNIKRLVNYINQSTTMQWECLICNYIWETTSKSIFVAKTGCLRCSGSMPLNNQYIDNQLWLNQRSIKRIDDYINNKSPIKWECLKCNNIWFATSNDVINHKTGCAKCSLGMPNNEQIDKILLDRKIKRLDDYINSYIHIKWQCEDCQHVWSARPHQVIYFQTGCPNCAQGKNERLFYSILEKHNIVFEKQKELQELNSNYPKYRVDAYISKINIIIELNGAQHYKPVCFGNMSEQMAQEKYKKQIIRDQKLQEICDDNNIKLIWIDGRIYKNSKLIKYIEKEIISLLK